MKIGTRRGAIRHIDGRKTALLVIDMQKAFIAKGVPGEISMGRKIIPRVKKVISFCRENGILVIYTRMSHEYIGGIYRELFPAHFKPDGSPYVFAGAKDYAIVDEIAPQNGDIVIDKYQVSAFYGTQLDLILVDREIDTLIIAGQASNVCSEQAARDAFHRGIRAIVLSDANATLTPKMHEAAMENVRLIFGYVMTSEEFFRLVGKGKDLVTKSRA